MLYAIGARLIAGAIVLFGLPGSAPPRQARNAIAADHH